MWHVTKPRTWLWHRLKSIFLLNFGPNPHLSSTNTNFSLFLRQYSVFPRLNFSDMTLIFFFFFYWIDAYSFKVALSTFSDLLHHWTHLHDQENHHYLISGVIPLFNWSSKHPIGFRHLDVFPVLPCLCAFIPFHPINFTFCFCTCN